MARTFGSAQRFQDSARAQTDAEGVERVVPWPEGDYLVRIAVDRPEKVTKILKSVASSRNQWVQRAIISAASKLPGIYARQLAQPIAKIIKSSTGWLNVHEVMAVVVALSTAGEVVSVRALLKAMFEPQPGPQEEMVIGTRTRIRGVIEDYFYAELLPLAVPILIAFEGIEGLKLGTGWLQKASRIQTGSRPERADYDASSIWRASIAPHEQNSGLHELTDSLIDAVRDTAVELGRLGRKIEVIEFLNSTKPFVMRRIATEVAATLLSGDTLTPELIITAESLLFDPTLMSIGSRPEYVHLALALLPRMTDEQRRLWVELVRSGSWQGTDEDIRRWIAWGDRNSEEVSTDEVAEKRQRVLHRFLQPLAGSLPPPLVEDLASFEAKWGKIEHPEFGSYMESFTGPTSPKTRDQLLAMTPDALAAYLEAWEPSSGDHHFGPSIEGLARELESVAEVKPELVAAIADSLIGLGRSYVRAALAGWAKAVPNGYVPSDAVWQMVHKVVQQTDDGSNEADSAGRRY